MLNFLTFSNFWCKIFLVETLRLMGSVDSRDPGPGDESKNRPDEAPEAGDYEEIQRDLL